MHNGYDALGAEAVKLGVAPGDGQAVAHLHLPGIPVAGVHRQQLPAHLDGEVHHPAVLLQPLHRMDGVVQQVSEQGVDIHVLEEAQPPAVGDAADDNVVFLAVQAFLREDDIQRPAAGAHHGIVNVDGLLHLGQGLGGHPGAAADGADLVAHVVAFPVDLVDGLAGDLVLVPVLPPQLVDDFQLVLQIALHQQGELRDKDEHAA